MLQYSHTYSTQDRITLFAVGGGSKIVGWTSHFPPFVMGKLLQFLLLCWVATVASAAFAPKKRAFKRQQQDQNPSLIQQQAAIAAAAAAYCSEQECYPPPFAFAQAAASMAPAQQHHQHHAHQDWDDDMVVGYGTGIVACVVSLALGLTLGYVGN